jgi:DNA-binding NtrC family response regulator
VSSRVLVADRSQALRDQLAELLGDLVAEVAWAPRDQALDPLRAAVADGQPFDVVVIDAEPGLTPAHVRELAAAGGSARIVLIASGSDGIALAARCGAADVVMRPLTAAELAFRIGRAPAGDPRGDKRRPRKTDILIGTGSWIKELHDRIAMVAATDVTRSFRELKQEVIDGFEKAYLTELLRVHRGNLAQAARTASMDRKNLWALVVRHGLDREQFRKP